MSPADFSYNSSANKRPPVVSEADLEANFIEKLRSLNYTIRPDIRDRSSLEANFREHFEALNRVKLTGGEFQRLLDEIVTPDAALMLQVLLIWA